MTKKFASSSAAFVFFLGIALVPGIAASVFSVGYLQRTFFPIMTAFATDELRYNVHGDIVMSGSFEKVYPDWACVYKDMNWYMPAKDSNGRPIRFRVTSEFGDARPKASNNNRHEGSNFFHDWVIGVSEYPDMRNLTGYVSHTCLGFIRTRTNFPIINIPIRYVP